VSDAPPVGEEGVAVGDATVCGASDEGDSAGADVVAPVCPAVVAGVGDDPVDAVQPAAAATTATAVTMPATRTSSEPEPVIPNHPSSVPAHTL
jgi:hypothetical protein